jgi:hypothetical protein
LGLATIVFSKANKSAEYLAAGSANKLEDVKGNYIKQTLPIVKIF